MGAWSIHIFTVLHCVWWLQVFFTISYFCSLSSPAVFAPTDAAFEALPAGALDYLLDNGRVLTYVLGYHVVPGIALSAGLTDGLTATTVIFEDVTFSIMDGVIKVQDAVIGPANVMASNGVIHVIDSVLIPPGFALPTLNIVEIGMADAGFSTLVAAVTAAGLADALSTEIYTLRSHQQGLCCIA
jgi:transforming growth factor-beta-induced protein